MGADLTLTDLVVGGIATIGLNNANVVLSAAQFRSANITYNSTLTGSVTITFPTSFTKPYTLGNLCTGSSAFTITCATTAAGGQVIALPPGVFVDVINDGTNIKFKNLFGPIGSYIDYAGSSMPNWNAACTLPPLLNCDGSPIPAAYTVLPMILGSSLLPDSRNRARFALAQGATRISSAGSGMNGGLVGAAGGNELLQSHTHVNTLNDPGHSHTVPLQIANIATTDVTGSRAVLANNTATSANVTGVTITNASAGTGTSQNMPPAYIGGLTLIRAA
jgi:hypothetical protein